MAEDEGVEDEGVVLAFLGGGEGMVGLFDEEGGYAGEGTVVVIAEELLAGEEHY